jgi:hypothetical protein
MPHGKTLYRNIDGSLPQPPRGEGWLPPSADTAHGDILIALLRSPDVAVRCRICCLFFFRTSLTPQFRSSLLSRSGTVFHSSASLSLSTSRSSSRGASNKSCPRRRRRSPTTAVPVAVVPILKTCSTQKQKTTKASRLKSSWPRAKRSPPTSTPTPPERSPPKRLPPWQEALHLTIILRILSSTEQE